MAATFTHRTADFSGVAAPLLRDASLISGLVVAAAGAAGLSAETSPAVRQRAHEGVSVLLTLEADGCHIAVHTFPDLDLMLLDVLIPAARDPDKAIEVFIRKVPAKSVTKGEVKRGIRGK